MSDRAFNSSNVSLKIIKTEIASNGESVQIVRPVVTTTKSSDQIVDELVQKFDYKTNEVKEATGLVDFIQLNCFSFYCYFIN
jgi:hypothetical protein